MPQDTEGTRPCKGELWNQTSCRNHPTVMAVEDLHCQTWACKNKASKVTLPGLVLTKGYDLSVICNPVSPFPCFLVQGKAAETTDSWRVCPQPELVWRVNSKRLLHPLTYSSVHMLRVSHSFLAKLCALIQARLCPWLKRGHIQLCVLALMETSWCLLYFHESYVPSNFKCHL